VSNWMAEGLLFLVIIDRTDFLMRDFILII